MADDTCRPVPFPCGDFQGRSNGSSYEAAGRRTHAHVKFVEHLFSSRHVFIWSKLSEFPKSPFQNLE